eukprot:5251491-Ditylum_brightwellii.AAC.1
MENGNSSRKSLDGSSKEETAPSNCHQLNLTKLCALSATSSKATLCYYISSNSLLETSSTLPLECKEGQ